MRFHGFDLPLHVEGHGLCMDCCVKHLPGGQRIVLLQGADTPEGTKHGTHPTD
jgi:hypothetical protein